MKPTKFIIPFIISTILIKLTLSTTFKANDIFASVAVDLKKNKNFYEPFVHCSCHKKDDLSNMMAVKFKNGNKYLISQVPIGVGGTALVFHAIYIGKKWEIPTDRPTKCEAIKVANPLNIKNNEKIKKELAIIDDIFKQPKEYSIWPPADHNLRFFRREIFLYKKVKHSAIVMELGGQNLYEYWQKSMPQFCQCNSFLPTRFCQKCTYVTVSETMLLYIMREISLGLEQLHQRNYIFIDLKPQNVMVMSDSPNPNELSEENFGRLKIKLTDFGSALKFVPEIGKRVLRDDEWLKVMGTIFYRAPELYDEFIDEISPKTDIYSLGRLMLMLAVQTPQMKKFIPQIKQFWVDEQLDGKCEECHQNWTILLDEMLRVSEIHPTIPLNLKQFSDHENEISEHESESDVEVDKILEQIKKEREEKKRKNEETNEFLRKLYEEMKKNFEHLMKIVEQTQENDQEKRPTISTIVKECSPKLAHLKRIQTEIKLKENSTLRKLFYSGVLTTQSSTATDSSAGSSISKGSISKISKRIGRRWSMENIRF